MMRAKHVTPPLPSIVLLLWCRCRPAALRHSPCKEPSLNWLLLSCMRPEQSSTSSHASLLWSCTPRALLAVLLLAPRTPLAFIHHPTFLNGVWGAKKAAGQAQDPATSLAEGIANYNAHIRFLIFSTPPLLNTADSCTARAACAVVTHLGCCCCDVMCYGTAAMPLCGALLWELTQASMKECCSCGVLEQLTDVHCVAMVFATKTARVRAAQGPPSRGFVRSAGAPVCSNESIGF